MVPRCMWWCVGCIATFFKIKGLNFSITSACSTSAHCISSAVDAIRNGSQDVVSPAAARNFTDLSVLFDAMDAMSSKYNAAGARLAPMMPSVTTSSRRRRHGGDRGHGSRAGARRHHLSEIAGYGEFRRSRHGRPVRRGHDHAWDWR